MVLQGCLTPDLEELWEQGRIKQKLVIQLCDMVVDGSPGDLKVLLAWTHRYDMLITAMRHYTTTALGNIVWEGMLVMCRNHFP